MKPKINYRSFRGMGRKDLFKFLRENKIKYTARMTNKQLRELLSEFIVVEGFSDKVCKRFDDAYDDFYSKGLTL